MLAEVIDAVIGIDIHRDTHELEIADTLPMVDGSLERSLEQIPTLAEAGITVVRVGLRRVVSDPSEIPAVIDLLARNSRV